MECCHARSRLADASLEVRSETEEGMARTIRQPPKQRGGHRPQSLAAKLSRPFLALVIISLLIVGASLTYASREAQRQRIQENQQKSADYAAATIALYLQQAQEDLKSFAQVAYLEREDRERQAATLGALWSGRQAAFESIALLDANGQELAKFATYYTFLPSDLTNQRESKLFQQALSGQVYVADKTETLRDSVRPIVRMGVPIQESGGLIAGVIAAEVNVKTMTDAVQKAQIGQSGYAYVIDQAGQLIAHSDQSSFLQFKDKDLTYVPIIAALVGASAAQIQGGYAGLSKTDVIGAYARIGLLPWYVVTELPSAEANVPINNMLVTLAALLAVTLTLSVGVGYWLPRRLIRPLSVLTQGAERIGQGDLSHRIDVKSNDELETLAEAFNAMTAQLRDLIGSLEQRVAERTAELREATGNLVTRSGELEKLNLDLRNTSQQAERRAAQLAASAQVAHAASQVRDLDQLLPQVTHLISQAFGYYHVGVFIVDEAGRFAVLRAANSEGGQRMLARGHKLAVGKEGIVGYVTGTGQPRIALDVGADAVHFDNPDLPQTRSEMALPLQAGERTFGALDVQSTQGGAFTQEDVAVLGTLADQIAIAIENARLFTQTQAALQEAKETQRRYIRQEWEKLSSVLQTASHEYRASGVPPVGDAPLPEIEEAIRQGRAVTRVGEDGLSARAALAMPIKLRDQLIGVIDLQETDAERQWTDDDVALVTAVADQVALALENVRLFEQTRQRAQREQLISQVTAKMRAAPDIEAILRTTVREVRRALGASQGVVRLGASAAESAPGADQATSRTEKNLMRGQVTGGKDE